MGVGVVEAANAEFQVVREKGRDREEGGRVAETVQEMQCLLCKEGEGRWRGAGVSLFDLRSRVLI